MDRLEKLLIPKISSTFNPTPSSTSEPLTIFFTTKYLENNFQCIFKTILKAKTHTTLILPEKLNKRLLKAIFLNVYYNKT